MTPVEETIKYLETYYSKYVGDGKMNYSYPESIYLMPPEYILYVFRRCERINGRIFAMAVLASIIRGREVGGKSPIIPVRRVKWA